MKLWIDDIRLAPYGFFHVYSVEQAQQFIKMSEICDTHMNVYFKTSWLRLSLSKLHVDLAKVKILKFLLTIEHIVCLYHCYISTDSLTALILKFMGTRFMLCMMWIVAFQNFGSEKNVN